MFQGAAWPLMSLASFSVDLDAVARRLRLTLETSWDEHGPVRVAFFVLDGTDFVVTHHEGDAPGTHVWTRKGDRSIRPRAWAAFSRLLAWGRRRFRTSLGGPAPIYRIW